MGDMNRVLTSLPLPRRLRDAGWGVLLVPVMLLVVTIFGRAIWWGVVVALAGVGALLAPVMAADVAAAGVVCLGLYATVLTGWMVLAFYQLIGNPFYSGVGLNPLSSVFITGRRRVLAVLAYLNS
jgi:hypothetical protein